MVATFTDHSADISTSSKGVFEYLEKENAEREVEMLGATEELLKEEEIELNKFFNQDTSKTFDLKEAHKTIDNNSSSNHKNTDANFYMINVSPSKAEIDHLKKIVDIELEQKGFDKKTRDFLEQTEKGKLALDNMKRDLMHQQLKEYSRDVMKDYAENFNRQVFKNENLLPNKAEYSAINKEAKKILEDQKINRKDENYFDKLEDLKTQIAKEKGFDLSKRPMNENDIVWFGKVEEKRTYKENDKWVIQNKQILKEVEKMKKDNVSSSEISKKLETLNKDRTTGEIVRAGMLKGGDQYHVHIVVSRYTNAQAKDKKISLSPKANHKRGKVASSNKDVGFDRKAFYNKVEKTFDDKFKFVRLNTFENYNSRKKQANLSASKFVSRAGEKTANVAKSTITNHVFKPIKNEIKNLSGMNEIRKLNPNNAISKELGFRIPLKIPTSPMKVAIDLVRAGVGKIIDISKGY